MQPFNMAALANGERREIVTKPSEIPSHLGRPFYRYVSGFLFEAFLYGINLMLFSATVFILVRKFKGMARWPLLGAAIAMFTVSTVCVCTSMYMLFGLLINGISIPIPIARTKHLCLLVNNTIADALLIYRCYAVWAHSRYVIAAPCALLVGSSIVGMVYMSSPVVQIGWRKYVYLWLTLSLNMSVTIMIATRVWWMALQARKTLGPSLARKYYSSLAIVIESGVIYSSYVLLDQILVSTKTESFVIDVGIPQIAFFAPTLIIVQLGLGRHIRDLQTNIRLTSRDATVVLSTVHSYE